MKKKWAARKRGREWGGEELLLQLLTQLCVLFFVKAAVDLEIRIERVRWCWCRRKKFSLHVCWFVLTPEQSFMSERERKFSSAVRSSDESQCQWNFLDDEKKGGIREKNLETEMKTRPFDFSFGRSIDWRFLWASSEAFLVNLRLESPRWRFYARINILLGLQT